MHWVLVLKRGLNQYIVIDPWVGKEIILNDNQLFNFHYYKEKVEVKMTQQEMITELLQTMKTHQDDKNGGKWFMEIPEGLTFRRDYVYDYIGQIKKLNEQLKKAQEVSDGFSEDLGSCRSDLIICQDAIKDEVDDYTWKELLRALGRKIILIVTEKK
jgi:hypothetical protein